MLTQTKWAQDRNYHYNLSPHSKKFTRPEDLNETRLTSLLIATVILFMILQFVIMCHVWIIRDSCVKKGRETSTIMIARKWHAKRCCKVWGARWQEVLAIWLFFGSTTWNLFGDDRGYIECRDRGGSSEWRRPSLVASLVCLSDSSRASSLTRRPTTV